MGSSVAKPTNPKDTQAKANADFATDAMTKTADSFLKSVRLGQPTSLTLGYKLTDGRLVNQMFKILATSSMNETSDTIKKGIHDIFGKDWEALAEVAADALVSFFSGGIPADSAVNETVSLSYLIWENESVVQYSCYCYKTNSKSVGLLTQDAAMCTLVVVCKGLVDYATVDPQNIVYEVKKTNPDMKNADFQQLMTDVKNSLQLAAELSKFKKSLEAGVSPKVASAKAAADTPKTGAADLATELAAAPPEAAPAPAPAPASPPPATAYSKHP